MKSFSLVLFIIFNLLAVNMASAFNMYNDEETTESHFAQIHDDAGLSGSVDDLSCDEPSCDHFCHFSAHVVGLISCMTLISMVDTSILVAVQDETFYSFTLDPPSHPPRA